MKGRCTNINIDSGVGGGPGTRNGDEIIRGREGCPSSSDVELSALRVELRGVCLMNRESLPADEVIAREQIRRNGSVPVQRRLKKTVCPLSVVDSPTDQAEFVNLEVASFSLHSASGILQTIDGP